MTEQYDPLLTMAALNMAVVSLHRITSTRDRVILDREYKSIINNLRMGEIKSDSELTELYKEIVRVIHRGLLRNEVREKIESSYSEQKQKSIQEIVKENVLSSFDSNPLKWLGSLAMSCASEYFSSKSKDKEREIQNDDEQRKLKSEELEEYDELQRRLLDSSWKLLQKYQLSDDYRLTQNSLEKFNAAIQENDPSKRLRMLKYIEGNFSMYSPYWFYRATTAQEIHDITEAEKSFAKFNEVWRPVLREDPYKVEALKFQVEGLMREGLNTENAAKILECLSEMKANTPIEDWANNIYEGTLYFTLGNKEKAIECVMCNVDFGYETETSKKLVEKFEIKESKQQIQLEEQEKAITPSTPEPSSTPPKPKEKSLKEKAKEGDPEAQYQLGIYYYDRCKKVTLFFISLVILVDFVACCYINFPASSNWIFLGKIFLFIFIAIICAFALIIFSAGFPIIYVIFCSNKSITWLEKAAEQEHIEAQYKLACLLNGNIYVGLDEKQFALMWFRRAAENGHVKAQEELRRNNF